MKIAQPYQCDLCKTYKKETNHWFIGWVSATLPVSWNKKSITSTSVGIVVVPWNEKLKDRAGVRHLCGSRCVTAFVAEALAGMIATPVAGTVASVHPLPYEQLSADKPNSKNPLELIAAAEKATEAAVAKKPLPAKNKLADIIMRDEKGQEIGEP